MNHTIKLFILGLLFVINPLSVKSLVPMISLIGLCLVTTNYPSNFSRKGQAAMEFLMTYGWAILAAIVAIGTLTYFGVISNNQTVQVQPIISPPFTAQQTYNALTGEVVLELTNAGPIAVTIKGLIISSEGRAKCLTTTNENINPGAHQIVTILGCLNLKGNEHIQVNYVWSGSQTPQTATGSVSNSGINQQSQNGGIQSFCGNGVVEQEEECDSGNIGMVGCNDLCKISSGYTCTGEPSNCIPSAICGNGGFCATNENCDSPLEICVNNFCIESGEQCDDGMQCDNGSPCLSTEECEVGGQCLPRDWDGCSSICHLDK